MDGSLKTYRADFANLTIGDKAQLKHDKMSCRVMDLSKISSLMIDGKTQQIHGLIGSSYLKTIRASFDFTNATIHAPLPDVPPGMFKQSRVNAGDIVIPLIEGGTAYPYVTLKLKDKEFAFVMDTGSANNTIEPAVAHQLGLQAVDAAGTMSGAAGGGKIASLKSVTVERPWFGRYELASLEFKVLPTQAAHTAPAGKVYGGIVGTRQLEAMKGTLDFDSYCLFLPKSVTAPPQR